MEVEYRAFELHPGIPPEGQTIPWNPVRMAAGRSNFARMADEEGLPHGERTHWYASTPAHEAAEWATELGAGPQFRWAVYRAYFVEDRNIGSAEVLAELAGDLGLDAADLRAALAEGRYRERVQAQYQEARGIGVTAVPTFVADQRYAIVGAHPYENFQKLMAVLKDEAGAED